jgi:hypothetical protein
MKVCKLCAHPRVSEINRFMSFGHSYKQFRAHFRLRSVSVYVWTRHKTHISELVQAQGPEAEGGVSMGLDVQTLRGINRKLRALAARAEKSGRMAHAVTAYSAIGRNVELLQRLATDSIVPDNSAPEAKMTAEQAQAELQRMCEEPEVVSDLQLLLYRSGHPEAMGLIAGIPTARLVEQLVADAELRARVMNALVEAEAACEPRPAFSYVIPASGCSENPPAPPEHRD